MTTYYVDFVNGSDANNGLGPDASAVTNKPWKTVTKLLGAAGMASGDTGYLAPGVFRETVTVAMTSPTVETKIIGDVANAQGFKTSGGVAVAPGEVQITAYTTNDKTAPANGPTLALAARDFLTFQSIVFVGGKTGSSLLSTSGDSTNITFTACAFLGYFSANVTQISITNSTAVALHWLFDRCRFHADAVITLTRHASADYDADVVFRNCTGFFKSILITATGANTFNPGGVLLIGCTFLLFGNPSFSTGANCSTTFPCKVENCVLLASGGNTLLSAATAGQITETFNILYSSTPRGGAGGVTAGTGSISDGSYAMLYHLGQENVHGASQRHLFAPAKGSPWLGFGSSASAQAVDLLNGPRPAGGASASKTVGALERGNTWSQETSTVRTGANALSITGPGYQDFDVAVDAASTTISVYMRYDSTYAGTKPTISVLSGAECGVADATSSAVTTVNTWEQLSLTFTPTAKGIVTLRLNSTDTNGGGKAFADDVAVA